MEGRSAPIADRATRPARRHTDRSAQRTSAAPGVAVRGLVNLVYGAALLFGGLTPNPPSTGLNLSDGTLHGAAYLIQTLLLLWLTRAVLARVPALVTAAVSATSYGAVIEVCQLLQPARSFESSDLAANLAGVAAACVVAILADAAARRRR